jgi:hypothetical protein
MDNGLCFHHGGQRENGGAPEGNDNAVTVAAWAESFYDGFLTEAEKERVEESAEILGEKAGAQEIARHAASVCLEQFRRTGDERFMRRYESLCEKAGLFPDEEIDVSADVDLTTDIDSDTKEILAEMMDREVQQ